MSRPSGRRKAFFYRNRDRGIPNLMLYIAVGNLIVYVLSVMNRADLLFYDLLRFDYDQILQWQLWRLISYPLTFLTEVAFGSSFGVLLGAIGLFFYYFCGRVIESSWGSLRLNLYYLTGVVLADAAAMFICAYSGLRVAATTSYLNLSLFLAVATLQPELGVRIWFVLPVKMKWIAWFELGYTAYQIVALMLRFGFLTFVWILPVFALLNYFLFFGKEFTNVLPDFLRHPKNRAQRQMAQRFRAAEQRYRAPEQPRGPVRTVQPYRFKCTVCGRTDVSDPKLEFRYCSRCAGYRCYCMDHINNHAHITE